MSEKTEPEERSDAATEPDPEEPSAPEGEEGTSRAPEPDPTDDGGEVEPVDRQARREERWRERARTAEERAERLATREVLRLLAGRVSDPVVALQMSGESVADLLTDDGDVDDEAVAALADRMAEAHPALRRTPPQHMDLGPKRTLPQRPSTSWSGLIRGK